MSWPAMRDLRAFLAALGRRGWLRRIATEVDPALELAEIHRRVISAGGPALLFENVRGSSFSVATNLFGTPERVHLAFGERPGELVARLARAPEHLLPPSPGKLWRERSLLLSLARIGTRTRRSAPVLARTLPGDRLHELPLTTSWPGDGGAFSTLGLVLTAHPESAVTNLGLYRLQRHDGQRLGLHWQIGKGGGFHHAAAEERGEALPVAVWFGGPPALLMAAVAPLPENVPELLLGSLLAGRRLALARDPDGPLPLAARAEFCLVGEARPAERQPEGPFGDHYGYYSLRHPYPVFSCRAIHHREGAILPATVVGKPRQEDFYLGDWLQDLLAPLFPLVMPGVRDLWSYGETGYHSLAAAVVRERYRREAMQSALRILGEGQLSLTKFLLVTDRSVDLRDFPATLTHVLERTDLRTDLYVLGNLSMDSLDYSGPRVNEGSKGVLLGLGEPRRALPRVFSGNLPRGIREAQPFCPGCLVVSGPSYGKEPDLPRRVAREEAFASWPLVVLADQAGRTVNSSMNFLWSTFTRFDPAQDLHARSVELRDNHPLREPPLVIDARRKPGYPPELFCDPDTAARVGGRWSEYFPSGGVEMGDSDLAHLDP